MRRCDLVLSLALAALAAPAGAENITFPPDAGVHNIRDLGAKGDGTTDDTAAIQKAFQQFSKKHMETVYFPDGTYLVSDTVWFAEWIFVQGQSRARTVIRLKDNCPGYDDPRRPKRVVGTTDPAPSTQCRNTNFSTHMLNFTLDTGRGNPGATAIEFMSHNGGGLQDMTLRAGDGEGACGIDMTRNGPGPALCKNVRIEGFNYGISIASDVYCSTFEHVALAGQKIAGIRNLNHPVAIRRLTSQNAAAALINAGPSGQIVLLDSDLAGGAPDAVAIDNKADGSIFARNVKVSGYRAAVMEKTKVFPAEAVRGEYTSGEVRSLWPSPLHSLNLPIEETPDLPWEDLADWISVRQFADKVAGDDWAPAIQAAIDSGKTTVYLPHGKYPLRSTVLVRGRVRVIQGCGSMLVADGEALQGAPALRLESPAGSTVWIDRLSFAAKVWGQRCTLEHASAARLVVLHSRWMSYRSLPGAGNLFVDDMCGAPWRFAAGQKVWIRQLDVESKEPKVHNEGAQLWVLGIKAEGAGTHIINTGGGRCEVLGGEVYPACSVPDDVPMWINTDSGISLVHSLFWAGTLHIKDTRQGETRELRLPKGHRFIDLFVDNP